jgi:hypothetical protein
MTEAYGKQAIVMFDDRVLEVFGAGDPSQRVHFLLISEIKLEDSMLVVSHSRGAIAVEYEPERQQEFERLVAVVEQRRALGAV